LSFYLEKDLAGCKIITKKPGCDCRIYRCADAKGLAGCYECNDFPCHQDLPADTRNRAFNQYARQYGRPALLHRLETNYANGIIYHHPDELKGNYDKPDTEAEIIRLIHFSSHNPFINCPERDYYWKQERDQL